MENDFYAEIAPIYDRMIRWERRLKLEEPLFAEIWRRSAARTVLDASCGSGRHLLLFQAQGRCVVGADASAAMLDLAREQLAPLPEAERPRLIHATWAELPKKVSESFDAVLCLGNSVPYVTDPVALRESLSGLWSRVAPGGFLLIQFRNFAKMRARGERFLPLSTHTDPAGGTEYLCVRQYDWHAHQVDFNVLLLAREKPAAEWALKHWTTPLATYAAEDIAPPLEALGARLELHGSLALEPFDPTASEDIVLWAQKSM